MIRIRSTGLEPPAGLETGETPPQIIFNNPRSSIKPGSAPDPTFLTWNERNKGTHW